MKTRTSRLLFAAATIAIALAGNCVHAAGYQHGFAADPDGKPLEIGIWYPSKSMVQPLSMGPTTMNVSVNGAVDGKALPLVVISHGSASSFLSHYDTAIALADAGFVVAAVSHAGDNYADQSRSNGAAPLTSLNARGADLRIKAAVIAAPALGFAFAQDGLKNVKVPVQLWSAENDLLVPQARYAEAVKLALPQAPDYQVVSNAGHYDFLVPCSKALAAIAPPICTSAAGFDRSAFHASFNAAVVSFMSKALTAGQALSQR